jgi:DNA-binding transcriptional MerR regulator
MLKISEFSKLSGVPSKTLRYYDEIGLFSPQHIETDNGYRLYEENQIARLNKILELKSMGFSLLLIKKILDENLPPEMVNGLLRQRKHATLQRIEEERERLREVEANMAVLELEQYKDYEVKVKSVPEMFVLLKDSSVGNIAECGPELAKLSDELVRYCQENEISLQPPAISMYYSFSETLVEIGVAFEIEEAVQTNGEFQCENLPAVEEMAYVFHLGPLHEVDKAHQAIFRFMEENGYVADLPVRDIYHQYNPQDPEENLVEIQYPLRRQS